VMGRGMDGVVGVARSNRSKNEMVDCVCIARSTNAIGGMRS
jgi:hypothetical protein